MFSNRVRNRITNPRRRSRPSVELLEDRLVPAVFNVNSLADVLHPTAGVVTLRSAIQAANTDGATTNIINLTVPGTYKITLAGTPGETDNAAGEFAILPSAGNVTIQNVSHGSVVIDGNQLSRVFDINPNDTDNPATKTLVTLNGITITGGVASPGDGAAGSGGGIRDQGNTSLTLNNDVVTANSATADGGGISMENVISAPWTLTVNDSIISNNHAGDAGGGIETDGTGKVFINPGTVITGNTCVNQGAGIWLDAISGIVTSVTVTNPGVDQYFLGSLAVKLVSVDGNGSGAQAVPILNATTNLAAVQVTNPGSGYDMPPAVVFTDSFFTPDATAIANIALNQSATLNINGATITNNDALTGPGGGIGNAGSSTVTILNSTVADNFSGMTGGGFADQNNFGSLIVANSLFLNNTAVGGGGGIQEGGPLTSITNSEIAGNSSGDAGGGILAAGTTLFVQNSTIANNTAAGNANGQGGGGIELQTQGGGLNATTITNTTITGNSALNNTGVAGGGIDAMNLGGDLLLLNDTINGNFAATGGGVNQQTGFGAIDVENTIIAGNTAATGVDAASTTRLFTDLGGNLIGVAGDANAGFTAATTQTGTLAAPLNPLLAPLGSYGGPVIGAPGSTQVLQTEALETGSPAIGNGTLSRAPAYDERGVVHLLTTGVNVGAVSAIVPRVTPITQIGTFMPLVSHSMHNGVETTVYVVNSTLDTHTPAAGTLTLRAAIDMANQTPGNKVIELLVPGVYNIALPGANTGTNASGAFAILPSGGDVTIANASRGAITINGNGLDRVFDINPGDDTNVDDEFTVTLQGLTITGGVASPGDGAAGSGGGIRDQGVASLTLNNDVVTNNLATADGGGVSMENVTNVHWVLTINNSIIENNHAGDAGGGVEADGSGKVFITGGDILDNTCVNQGAGIWLDAIQDATNANVLDSALLSVTNTLIRGNSALDMLGGGIGNSGNGAVTIYGCTIEDNFSGGTGGGFADANNMGTLTVTNSLFLDNVALADGGGIQEGGPTTTLTHSEIDGNSSGATGGGVFATGTTLTVLSCTIANNTAAGNGNSAGGGGIEVETTGTSTITTSTITGNRALNNAGVNGGGIDAQALAGALMLLNDTITDNFASQGGGIDWGALTGSSVSLENTIVALNLAATGVDLFNPSGTFTDMGGNLIGVAGDANTGLGAGSGGMASTQTGTLAQPLNPLLGPLGNNGGPVIGAPGTMIVLETEAPLHGSPAHGKGIKTGAPTVDERGAPITTIVPVGAVNG